MKAYRTVLVFTILWFGVNFVFDSIVTFVVAFNLEWNERYNLCLNFMKIGLILLLSAINWHPIVIYYFGLFSFIDTSEEMHFYPALQGVKRAIHVFVQFTMIPVLTSSLQFGNTNIAIWGLTYS